MFVFICRFECVLIARKRGSDQCIDWFSIRKQVHGECTCVFLLIPHVLLLRASSAECCLHCVEPRGGGGGSIIVSV